MNTQRRTADEQYQLIMECRNSGLSDYQWCTEHDINPGTFYNWVKRLRKKACYDIPPANGRETYRATPKQEVVKLEVYRILIDLDIACGQILFLKNPFPLTGIHTGSI